jgi:hypothetical protein
MGLFHSKKPNHLSAVIVDPNQELPKTREDIIKICGQPISETEERDNFNTICREEDCFLAGYRNIFCKRLTFENPNLIKVVYIDKNDNIMRTF